MRLTLLILLLLGFTACEKETPLTAKDILATSINKSGGEQFLYSQIKFHAADLDYYMERKGHIANFTVERKSDSITYKATYENGYTNYYINDSIQQETPLTRRFINSNLEGFLYFVSFPHVLKQNAVILNRNADIEINKKSHYVLHVSFTKVEGEPDNEFYLYIDKETYLINYTAEKYANTGNLPMFKRYYNSRMIEGIRFADYYSFRSNEEGAALENLVEQFKSYNLKDLRNIEFTDIEVTHLTIPINE